MAVDVRVLPASELERAYAVLEGTFGAAPHPDDVAMELGTIDPARFYGAWDGAELVATAGSFDFSMTVPGGPLPVAGVTWVGVVATHRRQGVLTALMARQLADLHDGGTAVAALWASEAGIYGRYGYGVASWRLELALPRGAAFRGAVEPGGLRLVPPGCDQVRATYARVAGATAGWPQRDEAWWDAALHDPEHRRGGAGPLLCVATDGGYALYATAAGWDHGLPAGEVRVREVVAETPAARARLWRYLLDLDLMSTVRARLQPPDEPLLLDLLAEPRAARAQIGDGLHVRLVDLPAALAGRRYAADIDVALAVSDPRCPWNTGTWRLVGGRDGASCTPTTDAPDLALSVADLGAAYLGGTPLRARGVDERVGGALSRTSTAFGPLDGAPWCPFIF